MKSARKSSNCSALPRSVTTRDVIAFKKHLKFVKCPEEPLEGRDEFLKLHPVCDGCRNERCAVLTTDAFGVRCVQCVKKRRMSKPTPWVAEMYQLYGHHVQPRYDAPASSSSNRHFSDEDFVESSDEEEEEEYESQKRHKLSSTTKGSSMQNHGIHVRFSSPAVASSSSSKLPSGSEIRVERRSSSEKGQVKAAQSKVSSSWSKEESDGLSKIYPLVARFAICRDRIRSASRPFVDDTRAKRLMAMLSELDSIGEEFSEVLDDVDLETLELLR